MQCIEWMMIMSTWLVFYFLLIVQGTPRPSLLHSISTLQWRQNYIYFLRSFLWHSSLQHVSALHISITQFSYHLWEMSHLSLPPLQIANWGIKKLSSKASPTYLQNVIYSKDSSYWDLHFCTIDFKRIQEKHF